MIRFADFDRSIVMAVDSRHPDGRDVAAEVARRGGRDVTLFLNGRGLPGINPAAYALLHQAGEPPPFWGHGTPALDHVRALAAAVKQAIHAGARSVLLVEDDVEWTDEFDRVTARAVPPWDWELLHFGAYHNWGTTEEVGPHVLRINRSFGLHCLAVRGAALPALARLLQRPTRTADAMIADRFGPRGNAYALWPSVAIQKLGISSVTGELGGWPALFASKGTNW